MSESPSKIPTDKKQLSALVEIVAALRAPDGCPWDKEQTHETLTRYAIEEAHELAEAIDSGSRDAIVSELGDLLLQVVLHSQIASEENRFSMEDVIESISEKMVRRHPHVFSNLEVSGKEEVMLNWEQIKAKEKGNQKKKLIDIPESLPSLIRSQKIGSKTKKYNFDWEKVEGVIDKVNEEIDELKEAIRSGSFEEKESELGDVLFSVAQLARHLDIDGEQALRKTNKRFEKRFSKMHELCEKDGADFFSQSKDQLESLWDRAKKELA